MILTSTGVVPLDEKMVSVAMPFIGPLGIPTRSFFLVLGSCKILGSLSLWKKGPMPEWFARLGLILSASCAAYGHYTVGDSILPPLIYAGVCSSLYFLDPLSQNREKKAE